MAWGKHQIHCFNYQWTCSGNHVTVWFFVDFSSCTFRVTPVETLHTILLGTYKHLVKKFMRESSTREKDEILAWMAAAFLYSGFSKWVTVNICYNTTISHLWVVTLKHECKWLCSSYVPICPQLAKSVGYKVWLYYTGLFIINVAYLWCTTLSLWRCSRLHTACQCCLIKPLSTTRPAKSLLIV